MRVGLLWLSVCVRICRNRVNGVNGVRGKEESDV